MRRALRTAFLLAALAGGAPALAQPLPDKLPGANGASGASGAGGASGGATSAAPTLEESRSKLEAQRADLEKERADLAARRAAASGEEADALGSELDAVDRVLAAMNDLQNMLERAAEYLARGAAPAAADAVAQLGSPPYSLDQLDALDDALDAARAQRTRAEHDAKLAHDEDDATRADLERREEARRKARDDLSAHESDPVAALAARRALRLAELESRRAGVRREQVQIAIAAADEQLERAVGAEQAVAAAIARVRDRVSVTPDDVDLRLAKLDQQEANLAREQERNQARIGERQSRLAHAERALERAAEKTPAAAAQVSAYRAELQTEKQKGVMLAEQVGHLAAQRELWRARAQVLRGEKSRDDARALGAKLAQDLSESERAQRILEARQAAARSDADAARAAADKAAAAGDPAAPWQDSEARALASGADDFARDLERLRALRTLQERSAADVAEQVAVRGLWGGAQALAERAGDVWGTEVTAVDDRPITVGKGVTALLELGVGWFAARFLSRLVGRLVKRRSRAPAGAVKAIESLSFYALLALFFLLALRSVNIPLTAFTLAGGALAVGIGFGSQNILNNFISGLILLTERPIQIGDIVEVDGVQGQVERIGPRSTRIKTFESTHLILPNSAFLEQRVVNLTLTDETMRGMVEVGVAYDSDTRLVRKLMEQVLAEHPEVMADPAPIVLFESFGESALVFRALFWVPDVLRRVAVASDLRFRLNDVFRETGIVLAFPQRDVHLGARETLSVRLVRERGETEEKE